MWPYEFVPGGVSSLVIQTRNPTSNYQAQNALVLSLKTTHQMNDSSINFFSESDIVMPITKKEFFCALAVKSIIFRCLLSDVSLVLIKLNDATEILQ